MLNTHQTQSFSAHNLYWCSSSSTTTANLYKISLILFGLQPVLCVFLGSVGCGCHLEWSWFQNKISCSSDFHERFLGVSLKFVQQWFMKFLCNRVWRCSAISADILSDNLCCEAWRCLTNAGLVPCLQAAAALWGWREYHKGQPSTLYTSTACHGWPFLLHCLNRLEFLHGMVTHTSSGSHSLNNWSYLLLSDTSAKVQLWRGSKTMTSSHHLWHIPASVLELLCSWRTRLMISVYLQMC